MVITIGDPLAITARRGEARYVAPVGGLQPTAVRIHQGGRQRGVDIALDVHGVQPLLGIPASALADEIVDLPDLLPRGAELVERVNLAPDWPATVAAIESILAAAMEPVAEVPELEEAWRLLHLPIQPSVSDVAGRVGWSRRHLTARFRLAYGTSPARLRRIVRFQRARDLLAHSVGVERRMRTIASVAAEAGYADHAHLDRDWQDLAGCPPTTWLAEEVLPFVQDAPPSAGHDEACEQTRFDKDP